MNIQSITVIRNTNTDIIVFETNLKAIINTDGNLSLKTESCKENTEKFLKENFPNIIPKFIYVDY